MILTEDNLEEIFERVGPYVSNVEFIQNWIASHIGKDKENIVSELEEILELEENPVKKTDFRIVKNVLDKM